MLMRDLFAVAVANSNVLVAPPPLIGGGIDDAI